MRRLALAAVLLGTALVSANEAPRIAIKASTAPVFHAETYKAALLLSNAHAAQMSSGEEAALTKAILEETPASPMKGEHGKNAYATAVAKASIAALGPAKARVHARMMFFGSKNALQMADDPRMPKLDAMEMRQLVEANEASNIHLSLIQSMLSTKH